jgi:hypothetical protein
VPQLKLTQPLEIQQQIFLVVVELVELVHLQQEVV